MKSVFVEKVFNFKPDQSCRQQSSMFLCCAAVCGGDSLMGFGFREKVLVSLHCAFDNETFAIKFKNQNKILVEFICSGYSHNLVVQS